MEVMLPERQQLNRVLILLMRTTFGIREVIKTISGSLGVRGGVV